jgi:hypothetical protein
MGLVRYSWTRYWRSALQYRSSSSYPGYTYLVGRAKEEESKGKVISIMRISLVNRDLDVVETTNYSLKVLIVK